jgi:predicted Fe-Mo cluster-binding NifX family protein
MKICIPSTGQGLDSQIDPRFGRAQHLLILDGRGSLKRSLPNPGIYARRGAGIAAVQRIATEGAKILIVLNIGPNAFAALAATKIKLFSAPAGSTVKQAFLLWKENKLSEIKKPSLPGGLGRGAGRGGGRGQGFRRGLN